MSNIIYNTNSDVKEVKGNTTDYLKWKEEHEVSKYWQERVFWWVSKEKKTKELN